MPPQDALMSPTVTDSSQNSVGTSSSAMVTPDDKGIKEPAENDVLCGRGGSINSHVGNEHYVSVMMLRIEVL